MHFLPPVKSGKLFLAKAMADKNPGYEVYDWNGKQVYPDVAEGAAGGMTNVDCPFLVKVSIPDFNIRKGAGWISLDYYQ